MGIHLFSALSKDFSSLFDHAESANEALADEEFEIHTAKVSEKSADLLRQWHRCDITGIAGYFADTAQDVVSHPSAPYLYALMLTNEEEFGRRFKELFFERAIEGADRIANGTDPHMPWKFGKS